MEKIYIPKQWAIKAGALLLLVIIGMVVASQSKGEITETSWPVADSASIRIVEKEDEPSECFEEEPSYVGVHVTGAVQKPDQVYYLKENARVGEAIEAAGGANSEADLSQLNLAGHIQDGQRIYVPQKGEKIKEVSTQQEEKPETPLTNINLATKIELLELPGIGEAYAQRILDYRDQNGPFETIEDLMNVKGIGENKFAELKDRITVE